MIKRNFLDYRAAADEDARVMVKMGAYHLMRGLTPSYTFDIGNLLHELAIAEGGRSFHVLAIGGPGGTRAALDPKGWSVQPIPSVVEQDAWAAPLGQAAREDGWTLFDLRPLRKLIGAGSIEDVSELMERYVFGYDAIVVIPGSTPAAVIARGS